MTMRYINLCFIIIIIINSVVFVTTSILAPLCYEHKRPSVSCPSVCLSVVLMDCDHTMQQRVEISANYRIDQCILAIPI